MPRDVGLDTEHADQVSGLQYFLLRAIGNDASAGHQQHTVDLRGHTGEVMRDEDDAGAAEEPGKHNIHAANPTVAQGHRFVAEYAKFVIEREIPGAGQLTAADLQAISQKSCGVLNSLGPKIQWVQSFVTDDKVYCVYIAPNADIAREHAKQGGFPANRISQVRAVIDRTTSE